MNISIRKMSDYAESLLKSPKNGVVHSVYRRTINLAFADSLLALQAEDSPLSPISLVTDLSSAAMEMLSIEKGDYVRLPGQNSILEITSSSGIHRISFIHARRYRLLLPGMLSASSLHRLGKNIGTAILHADTGGFERLFNGCPAESLPLLLLTARKHIEHASVLYQRRQYQESADALLGLLGLGAGLTPGGDDFLCGVLAGIRLSGMETCPFSKALRNGISNRLSDTVDISAAFLSCALKNQYSLAVNSLCIIPSPGKILSTFSEIGHSSGLDTLCGILYAISLKKIP